MSVVIVHGLGQSVESWKATIKYMDSEKGIYYPNLYELISNGDIIYENLYTYFVQYCNSINGTIKMCGLSLGAVLALNYAIDYPQKVESLILIAAQFKMPKNLLRFQNLIFKFMPENTFHNIGVGKKDFIKLSKSMMEIDFSNQLDLIGCPVLLLCGEKDGTNKKATTMLHSLIKNSSLEFVEKSSHEVNKDNPEWLAKRICEFFNLRQCTFSMEENRNISEMFE